MALVVVASLLVPVFPAQADGITWTSRDAASNDDKWESVAYGNGLWVAVGAAGAVMTSENGITWTSRTSTAISGDWRSVAYGGGLWVAVGAGGAVMTSSNGTAWTSRTSGVASFLSLNSVAYGGVCGSPSEARGRWSPAQTGPTGRPGPPAP